MWNVLYLFLLVDKVFLKNCDGVTISVIGSAVHEELGPFFEWVGVL